MGVAPTSQAVGEMRRTTIFVADAVPMRSAAARVIALGNNDSGLRRLSDRDGRDYRAVTQRDVTFVGASGWS